MIVSRGNDWQPRRDTPFASLRPRASYGLRSYERRAVRECSTQLWMPTYRLSFGGDGPLIPRLFPRLFPRLRSGHGSGQGTGQACAALTMQEL